MSPNLDTFLPAMEAKVSSCVVRSDLLGSQPTAFTRVYRVGDLLDDFVEVHDDLRRLDREFLTVSTSRDFAFDETAWRLDDSILGLYRRWHATAQRLVDGGLLDRDTDDTDGVPPEVIDRFKSRLDAIRRDEPYDYRPELAKEGERLAAEIWQFIEANG